ncbi:MAG: DegT/DnrJ/EryC1/StrS family aminotransferase [Candidatus Saganbacteria bacterium]|nr:DegT/DnrJ/EryC1/StrS family aminotransferase [Candidatus Saganbacteria bacterium]
MGDRLINVFKPVYRKEECLKEIGECFDNHWTGIGYKTIEFEEKWKEYTGFRHAHFLNSCTAALHLGIKLLGIKYKWDKKAEILTTPITFVSTNHAILYNDFKPVFVDVDDHVCLDPADLEKKITKNTKAIMFMAFGGGTGRFEKIKGIAKKYGLKIILDNAHAAGTKLGKKTFGPEEEIACYSFHSVKNLPIADGGMLCTSDGELDALARKMSWLGINKDTYTRTKEIFNPSSWKYDVDCLGHNLHGNSILAAIGIVQLKYLDADNAYRRELCERYIKKLKNRVNIVPVPDGCESSRHLFCIRVAEREMLIRELRKNNIYPGVHYRNNLEYPMYRGKGRCPNAEKISSEIITLPLHLDLAKKDIDHICDVILNSMQKDGKR